MLSPVTIKLAVDLQRRSYELLRWLGESIRRGFISFDSAHRYSTFPSAAQAWIEEHYLNIPPAARPPRDHLGAYCLLFTTYLESSFDLVANPGRRLYSPDAHCFCPMCSWLVEVPHLRAKRIGAPDRRKARALELALLRSMAVETGHGGDEAEMDGWLDEREFGEAVALCAYGVDLVQRMEGHSSGPATLALWRRFAWSPKGSPRKGFKLSADAILAAEKAIVARLGRRAGEAHDWLRG